MKILIAGATGFIGRNVLLRLLKQNHSISIIQSSNKNNLFDNQLDEKIIFNILKNDNFEKKLHDLNIKKFDCLLFFFWADLPNYNSHTIHKKNYLVSKKFIDFLFKEGLKKIYTAGTCYEYLGYSGEVNEDLKINTKLPYPYYKNKLRSYLNKKYNNRYSIKSSWIRIFYVYSKEQKESSLVPQLHKKNYKNIDINSSSRIIDISHVNTHVKLIIKILCSKKSFKVVNCCSGKPISIKRFVLHYIKRHNLKINVKFRDNKKRNYETDFWGSNKLLNRIIDN